MVIDGSKMMSKTQHYRKVTKPLLERKRRARMNLYLDELKDLVVETMEEKGEHITKLEKADILEMTVNFLRSRMDGMAAASVKAEKFRAGYTQAAYEVSRVFASIPGTDVQFGTKLMKHLGYKLKEVDAVHEEKQITSKQFQPERRQDAFRNSPTSFPGHDELSDDCRISKKYVWRPW